MPAAIAAFARGQPGLHVTSHLAPRQGVAGVGRGSPGVLLRKIAGFGNRSRVAIRTLRELAFSGVARRWRGPVTNRK
jgi:hypothetical protein